VAKITKVKSKTMHKKSVLEKPDADFLAQANSIETQCTSTEAAAWSIPTEMTGVLTSLVTHANTAYAANNDPATKNRTTSTAKKTAFGELKNFLGTFIKYLQGNLLVPDEALETMGIPSRHHHAHQPVPRPAEAPVITTTKQHDEITVYVSRPEHDHPTHSVTESGYHGFRLRYKKEDETELHVETATRLHLTVHFERADEGKRVTFAAAWINPRLEEGPWSPDISEIIG
jgi:hypothetical protein